MDDRVKVDWSKAKSNDIDSLTNHIEDKKNKSMIDAIDKISNSTIKNVIESKSGMSCMRCKCTHGDPAAWNDHWDHGRNDGMGQSKIVRHHTKARRTLFTPSKVNGGPKDVSLLLPIRVTAGEYINGEKFFHVDDWHDERLAHAPLKEQWTGVTVFHYVKLKEEKM